MISTDLALHYHLGFDSWWLLWKCDPEEGECERKRKRREFKLLIAWKASKIWMNLEKVIFVINDPITYWNSIRSFGGWFCVTLYIYLKCYNIVHWLCTWRGKKCWSKKKTNQTFVQTKANANSHKIKILYQQNRNENEKNSHNILKKKERKKKKKERRNR